jgi:pimeloyl-ACP methyl ester carboxylesterase
MSTAGKTDATFVLVHGSGFGGWIWDEVVPRLSRPAIAVDLPGRRGKGNTHSFEEYVQAVIQAISSARSSRVILVGHSIGAEFALVAASRVPEKVAAFVAVGGLIPEVGASYYSLFSLPQGLFLRFLALVNKGGFKPPNSLITKAYAADLNSTAQHKLLSQYAYESPHIFSAPVSWTLPPGVPRYYIRFLHDASGFSPEQQSVMAKRLGACAELDLDCGHLGMLNKPRDLADILNSIVP